jgi:hypothetical protein
LAIISSYSITTLVKTPERSRSLYHVAAVAQQARSREPEEEILGVRLSSPAAIWEEIAAGQIRDSFTLQAMALYEKLRTG